MIFVLVGLVSALGADYWRRERASLIVMLRSRERIAQDKKRNFFSWRRRAEARRQPFDEETNRRVEAGEKEIERRLTLIQREQQRITAEGRCEPRTYDSATVSANRIRVTIPTE